MLRGYRFFCKARVLAIVLLSAVSAFAIDYGFLLGDHLGGEVVYRAAGPSILMDSVDPSVRKWYLPQTLYQEYRWKTWEYTNYALTPYRRYVEPLLGGDYFYDIYGNFLTKGWLVYNWTEERPRISEGSQLLKRHEYAGFFSSLVIASDRKGDHSFAITVGDELFTTLTPMTFRKAVFNGAQIDFMSNRLAATGLFSRISAPGHITDFNPGAFNSFTNLIGGRTKVRLGDFVTVGGTFVNAHNGRGTLESFKGNPFKGELTTYQLENQINLIIIRLSNDSSVDGPGGAVLLADNVEIKARIGDRDTLLVGNTIGFTPEKIGGTIREGVRTVDGAEHILLRYDLVRLMEILDDRDFINNIQDIRFRLVLANDYKVEITSNRQINAAGQPVFLAVTKAEGNIRDGSNKEEVVFNYGLPTANQIFGFTVEVSKFMGFDLYTELNFNHRYRKYPNRRTETHKAYSGIVGDEVAHAWMMNLSKALHPWSFFAEAFYMDEEYTTSPFIVDGNGRVDYEDPTRGIYDFVDDNDDQDRKPDQKRLYQDPRTATERGLEGRSFEGYADEAVFPGWDENNDFVVDFNQNRNRFPDYDEPFLRYNTDRPEFLFGMDMNNNGWVDRFENDDLPDYPYKKDRKGYNVYMKNQATPHLQFIIGQLHEQLISDARENLTRYALIAFDKNYARIGRIRLFDMVKKTKDNIPDDLIQWVQIPGRPGGHQRIEDPLFAEDTWINTFWVGFDRQVNWGMNFSNKFKYETVNQRKKGEISGFRDNTRFLGIINKFDYLYSFGNLKIRPKFKSELLKDNTPYSMGGVRPEREQWAGIFFLVLDFPVLRKTNIEVGTEQMFFVDMHIDESTLVPGDLTNDFRNTVLALQLSNRGDYVGYHLITQLGFSISRISWERFERSRKVEHDSSVFLSIYASLRG